MPESVVLLEPAGPSGADGGVAEAECSAAPTRWMVGYRQGSVAYYQWPAADSTTGSWSEADNAGLSQWTSRLSLSSAGAHGEAQSTGDDSGSVAAKDPDRPAAQLLWHQVIGSLPVVLSQATTPYQLQQQPHQGLDVWVVSSSVHLLHVSPDRSRPRHRKVAMVDTTHITSISLPTQAAGGR